MEVCTPKPSFEAQIEKRNLGTSRYCFKKSILKRFLVESEVKEN